MGLKTQEMVLSGGPGPEEGFIKVLQINLKDRWGFDNGNRRLFQGGKK